MKTISGNARRKKCPSCGALVFCDDAQQTIHHEAPACAWFDKFMRGFGAQNTVTVVEASTVRGIGRH